MRKQTTMQEGDYLQAPPEGDRGLFAMLVIIGITIFAFIFILFVSGVE